MIIVIRGTNGSGKSHTIRRILEQGALISTLPEHSSLIRLDRVARAVLVIGPYIEGRSMGGCDCIRQPSKIYDLIQWADERSYHVLLEGVVLATRPYLAYYHDEGISVRYAFLDTPIAQCLTNIRTRQARKGQVSHVSKASMLRKRDRAQDMFERAQQIGMIARRFTSATQVVPWALQQLRSA